MDKKIKKLIDQNVFNSDLLDYDIEIEDEYFDDDLVTLKFIIYVDSYKLYKSSGYFNEEYYNLITDLADGNFDEELFDFLPMVGYSFSSLELFYDKSNLGGYKQIFYALDELSYRYEMIDRYHSSPWLYIKYDISDSKFTTDLYKMINDEFDIDVDDIVLIPSQF